MVPILLPLEAHAEYKSYSRLHSTQTTCNIFFMIILHYDWLQVKQILFLKLLYSSRTVLSLYMEMFLNKLFRRLLTLPEIKCHECLCLLDRQYLLYNDLLTKRNENKTDKVSMTL